MASLKMRWIKNWTRLYSVKLLKTRNFDFMRKKFSFKKVPKNVSCRFSTSGITAILVQKTENVPK